MHRQWVMLVAVTLSACSISYDRVQERRVFWQQVIASEVPVGSDRVSLEDWALVRSIRLSIHTSPSGTEILAGLESVPTDTWFCRSFGLSALFHLYSDGKILDETVRSLGSCV
jgi:hypothetical protein